MPTRPGQGAPRAFSPSDLQRDFFARSTRSFAEPSWSDGRIGVVDAGSNSVRLVVFEGGRRSPAVVHNEKVMCGLGSQLSDTGRLDPEGRERALRAMRRFAAIAEGLSVASLAGVATAAIRDAEDGPAFRREVERETGIRLKVASGTDEARLAAQGVIFGNPRATGVVVDLGGASMELCCVDNGRTGTGVTTPLGPLRLKLLADAGQDVRAIIAGELAGLDPAFLRQGARLYLVGGAWRALAKAEMERTDYPLRVLHEYTLTAAETAALARWSASEEADALAALPRVSESRAPVLPLAGLLLGGLVEALKPREVTISAFGLREGVCLEAMPPALLAFDPLISACMQEEKRKARNPGFGAELGDWVLRILPAADAAEERLMRAAAFLSDVNWRTHPDYRVNGCWDSVTRATITDIGHRGRVMMGAALSMRHKRGKRALDGIEAAKLLSDEDRDRAEQIGLAMKLGHSIAAGARGILPDTRVERDAESLKLSLSDGAREFSGEEVEKRLSQFAKVAKITGEIV